MLVSFSMTARAGKQKLLLVSISNKLVYKLLYLRFVKRITLVLLTAIYLLSCIGMGVNRFYCCGRLVLVKLTYGAVDNTESKSSSPKKDNCCRHEKQSFKIKNTHFGGSFFSLIHPTPVIIQHITFIHAVSVSNSLYSGVTYHANAPPGHTDIPIYNLNCTYRI